MRIRILHTPPVKDIDGIQLDCFEVGRVYEVGNSIAALFLAEGWAEPVALDEPPPPTPFGDDDPYDDRVLYRNDPPNLARENQPPYFDRDMAADFKFRRHLRRRRSDR